MHISQGQTKYCQSSEPDTFLDFDLLHVVSIWEIKLDTDTMVLAELLKESDKISAMTSI